MKRIVIIGLDGVPYRLLKDFADKGIMPNTKALIAKGTFNKMKSSIPEISSVAWSSIITGKNPGEHGIFGFTDFHPNTYRLSFPNFSHLKTSAFWENNGRKRHIIINVPSTYPARQLNGILISGFVALDFDRAVYPASVIPNLENMDYKIDVDSEKAHKSLEFFIRDLNRTNEARISAYRYLWDQDWHTFMFVFTGTDRLMHFLWDAYEDQSHDFHQEFAKYFMRIDEIIGEISSKMQDEDDFIMLSDHGFERLEQDVYINHILRKEGFLRLKEKKRANFADIDYGTKAFALDPARIYINLQGKYPRGDVLPQDRDNIIAGIKQLFENLTIGNKKVIKHIYRKEDIYKGSHIDRAPDLVLVGSKGFNLKAALGSDTTYSKGVFKGKHTQDDAFLLVNKKYDSGIISKEPNVCDIVGILNRLTNQQMT